MCHWSCRRIWSPKWIRWRVINRVEGILTEITIGSREADATLKREHAAETKEIERLMEPFMMGSWMEQ